MATTADFKNGLCIKYNGDLWKIESFQHVKPGKGPAFVRTKLKDISSGKIIDETFNSGIKLQFLKIEAKEMQFLYSDSDSYIFMDSVTYEQFNVSNDQINDNRNYLKPGMNVLVWGASGGIGSMAVQICKAVGANAIGVVSDDDKIPFVESLGAVGVLNRKKYECFGQLPDVKDQDGYSSFIKKCSLKANKFQSGFIYQYAFVMLLGFSALLTFLIVK